MDTWLREEWTVDKRTSFVKCTAKGEGESVTVDRDNAVRDTCIGLHTLDTYTVGILASLNTLPVLSYYILPLTKISSRIAPHHKISRLLFDFWEPPLPDLLSSLVVISLSTSFVYWNSIKFGIISPITEFTIPLQRTTPNRTSRTTKGLG